MDILNTKIKNILTEKTNKIRPENIKSGVNIFGIGGTYTGGGKNVQFNNECHVTSYTGYTKGIEITVNKTGTYKITRQLRRISTSGTWASQLYINGTPHGSSNETWGMGYYLNTDTNPATSSEWQQVIEEHVSLQEGDTIATYGRSNGNGNWLYHIYLLIEEE